ncbi:MAG: four helix bundle protein [Ignavibacteriales bacterium]|nr:four helix bundle protein [Ignavibacteriales bacterium]
MSKESAGKREFDLEKRLVNFAVQVVKIAESLPGTKAGNHLAGQLVRSGTSPALNYGEAQSAESKNDFIHKIKVVLKELRETGITLQIVGRASLYEPAESLVQSQDECNQLISIFVKSVQTAESRRDGKRESRISNKH